MVGKDCRDHRGAAMPRSHLHKLAANLLRSDNADGAFRKTEVFTMPGNKLYEYATLTFSMGLIKLLAKIDFRRKKMKPSRINAEEVYTKVKTNNALLVCAYESNEKYAQYNIDGSIPFSEFADMLPSIPKTREIIFFCA